MKEHYYSNETAHIGFLEGNIFFPAKLLDQKYSFLFTKSNAINHHTSKNVGSYLILFKNSFASFRSYLSKNFFRVSLPSTCEEYPPSGLLSAVVKIHTASNKHFLRGRESLTACYCLIVMCWQKLTMLSIFPRLCLFSIL